MESLTVSINISEAELAGSVDNRVAWNFVNAALVKHWNDVEILSCELALFPANGKNLCKIGMVAVTLKLNKMSIQHPIAIAGNISYHSIAGHDVIRRL